MASKYNKFSDYLKQQYGEKVWKIPVDAGFSCPNRDAITGNGGCIFCRIDSFSKAQSRLDIPVKEQILSGIDQARDKSGINKYLIYFQASTNTFAEPDELRRQFEEAIDHKGVVGLSIATRPDCLPAGVLELLKELTRKVDVWVELGLQSVHNETLRIINRGDTYESFLQAVEQLKEISVRICAHIILGLPNEGEKEIQETAFELSRLDIHEVKIHPLLILKGTPLENMYRELKIKELDIEDYIQWTCDFLEILPPNMVIQRLTAEAPKSMLIAPSWASNKLNTLNRIDRAFERRGSRQSEKYNSITLHSAL